jgi:hypothetical protein
VRLDRALYEELRTNMRQNIVRLHRSGAMAWEVLAEQRRLSRLDMAWARDEEWHDYAGHTVS